MQSASASGIQYRWAGEIVLIPTLSKRSLPKEHSYPIGAQAISDALAKVSQFDRIGVSFCGFSKSVNDQRGQILVLAADYQHRHVGLSAPNCLIDSGWYEPQWCLEIYAVPREKRNAINTALLSNGLGIVENWLSEVRSETWLDSSHRLELGFNLISGHLSCL